MSNSELENKEGGQVQKHPVRDWRAIASRNVIPHKMSEYVPPEEVRRLINEARQEVAADDLGQVFKRAG